MEYRGTCRDVRHPLEDHALNSTCHRTLAREIIPGSRDSQLIFVFNGETKEIINSSAISQMFELDFIEQKNAQRHGLSKEDRKFLQIAEDGFHHCEDGHYELPLPLKNEGIEPPKIVMQRFAASISLKDGLNQETTRNTAKTMWNL